ncbi:unnamed protein product [Rhizoctonia solani]|uniref:Carboxypeptidase n=1 Tax=Rhizoctonia solani TaxID=456999 RepID=A0A8H3D403_9AGAM|nr:unnamed protein product [Rhizoctonia solani]
MVPLYRQISGTSGTSKPATATQSSTAEQRFQSLPTFSRDTPPGSELSRGSNITAGLKKANSVEPHVESNARKVSVGWKNGVTSHFKTLWGSSIQQSPPTVSYEEVMKDDIEVYKWLQKIDEFGFCFISGVPPNPKDTEALTRRIAFIRDTKYGGFWDFTSDLKHGDTAYTNLALGAHTDTTYLSDPCGLQLFHLLSHEGAGGKTLLVDGFYAAAKLREKYPSHYELLTEVKISAHAAGDADSLYIPDEPFSILKKDLNGELMRVRYNNHDRSALKYIDPVLVDDWYDALRSWNRCLTSSDAELWVRLTAGTAVVVDNHRVLHGRSAFTGKRRMCGAYVGADEWKSRLRVLSQAIDRLWVDCDKGARNYKQDTNKILGLTSYGPANKLHEKRIEGGPDHRFGLLALCRYKLIDRSENFLPKIDGVTRCLARLLKHLREEGHDVMILGPEVCMSTYETYPMIGTTGIPLMLYPDLKLNFLRPKFLRSIQEFKPDVIHIVDPIWLGPQVLYALRKGWCGSKWTTSNAPIVASFHTNLPTYASLFGLKFLESIMWRWIRHNHAQCHLTACPTFSTATMLMHKGIQNIRIWPRGVDLNSFSPHKRCLELRREWGIKGYSSRSDQWTNRRGYPLTPPPSPIPSEENGHTHWNTECVILYTGRLSYEKNLRFLVDSYSLLLDMLGESTPTPFFVFAGEGPARGSLEELCRLKSIPARFTGHLSGEQLAKCYASADIFAFPSYTETFGQVVLEALASGLPVVGLDADGTRDLVQHERTVVTSLALSTAAQRETQVPLHLNPNFAGHGLHPNVTAYGANVQPLELSALSVDDFTVAGHQSFPSYQVRVKRVKDFCDPTVNVYSGYLDVDYGAKHLFFYFFESRSDPNSDPVLMWVGVGFSYADYGETISTTEDAAKNVQAFVTIFFETFSKFKGREFHMSGESYGGRYLPVFASEIIDQNSRAAAHGFEPINLKSVLIGNGLTDFKTMWEGYYDIQCKNLSVVPFQDIKTCVSMKQQASQLQEPFCLDPTGCNLAAEFCNYALSEPYHATGRNPYDMTKPCKKEELASSLCYPITNYINEFLDRPETRRALGVHPSIGNYTGCSHDVGERFKASLDHYHSNQWYITGLLERGVKVLIYVGTYDWICNWVGNQKWVMALDWTGGAEFTAQKDRDWVVDGQVAGFTRSANGLTFATVNAAGHMVPYDKPKEALAMLSRWLEGEEL